MKLPHTKFSTDIIRDKKMLSDADNITEFKDAAAAAEKFVFLR